MKAPSPETFEHLQRFARCEISVDELYRVLASSLGRFPIKRRPLPWFGLSSICPPHSIEITRDHLDRALARRRRHEITEADLRRWATMILINEAFYWDGNYKPLLGEWINRLSLDL